ncbi:MAG TPA: penicillin acylase family protein [Longimicrobium sp.]|nr:penicillin acylase family protein [Longimicrobium sp.]
MSLDPQPPTPDAAPPAGPVPPVRRKHRWLRRIGIGLLGLVALVLVLLAGTWWYIGRATPDYGRGTALAGLTSEVDVWRDSLGVPHVWARNETDLFRAMGYVHAQDRLWQMELFRRIADGRMAEMMGAQLAGTDLFFRTVGMGHAAAETERRLDPETRAMLQAYADGVNAWIEDHPGPLPPEFLVLRFKPEPWTVRNSIAIGKIMAWDLADWNLGLEMQRATDAVGPALARDLNPAYPDWGTVTLGADGQWQGRAGATPAASPGPAPAAIPPVSGVDVPGIPPLAAWLAEGVSAARASNAWVIGGSRTKSGKPILANDTHLALRAPSLWYLAALHGGGVETAGMTIPGIPLVVIGHGKTVAWGFTNAMTDDVDFFVEEVNADSTQYRTATGWEPFQVRKDTIRIKGAEPVVVSIRSTRNGTLFNRVDQRGGDRMLSFRWTAQDPSTEIKALLGMNRARNAGEFTTALHGFDNPHQNVVFADADGNFGYWMAGRVPVRAGGDGVLPTPAWTGEGAWTGFLAFDEHPHVLNPAEGFIVTANNRQAGPSYPHFITSHWAQPYRADRIRELVSGGRGFTAADVARQQMDLRDALAVRYRPHAVRAAELAGDSASARLLRAWNGEATADSRAASLFYVWWEALRQRVGNDEFGDKPVYFPHASLEAVLDRNGGAWVDDVKTKGKTETLDEVSSAAMGTAVKLVAGRPWGEMLVTRMDHPLGAIPALERVFKLNVGPFPAQGSHNTVNVAGFGARTMPYVSSFGPSQRHVVDMAAVDEEGGFIVTTGQSGVPSSPHYRDQLEMWRTGRLWRIPLDRARAESRVVTRMKLTPAR